MAHPVLYQAKNFFYPIGNTSAVVLTDTLAPEEPADLLLLGCGDPRNILFTVYNQPDDGECRRFGSYFFGLSVDFQLRERWTSPAVTSNLQCWVNPLSCVKKPPI